MRLCGGSVQTKHVSTRPNSAAEQNLQTAQELRYKEDGGGGDPVQIPEQDPGDHRAIREGEKPSASGQNQVPGSARTHHDPVRHHHQEPHGAAAQPGLLPAHQQPQPGQPVAHHGSGLQSPPGRRRLPLHDLRLPGDVRPLTGPQLCWADLL